MLNAIVTAIKTAMFAMIFAVIACGLLYNGVRPEFVLVGIAAGMAIMKFDSLVLARVHRD